MKKLYTLLSTFVLISTLSAQTYLYKDFNDTSITSGGWSNVIVYGTDDWYGSTFSGAVFAKATNYNGTGNDSAHTWMISPAVDLSSSNVPMFSFSSVTNYVGDQLEVYVSTDYDGTSDPTQQGTWAALSPNLPTNTSSWSSWTPSGDMDLSAYKSTTTYVGFKYIGSTTSGKTWEVDSIQIVESVVGPTIAVTTTDAACGASDGSATVTISSGTTPYSYLWNNGMTTTSITGLTQGTYTVTVTDGNSASSIASGIVGTSNGPSVTVTSSDALCNGSIDGSISVSGLSTFTYVWSNGSTLPSLSGLTAGTYSYTVTDASSCSSIGSVTVGEPATIVVSTSSTTAESAQGALDGAAIVSATGGDGNYTFMWQNGNTSSTLSGVAEGDYGVTVTDGNGCTGTDIITVPANYLTLTSIYEIQYTTASSGDSPYDLQVVMTKGVVSGYCDYNNTNAGRNYRGYFIQDGDSAWSGLYVNDTVNWDKVSAGDTVLVTGTIDENQYPYWGYTMMHSITSFSIVDSTGPEPTAIPSTTLEANKEKYEGVLVSCTNMRVNDISSISFGEWISSDGSGDLMSGNLMYWMSPDPAIDDLYSVTGVMFSEFNDIILEPRRPSDVTFLGVYIGIDEKGNASVNVYPNPASGMLLIDVKSNISVKITDELGRIVITDYISGKTQYDISNQPKGIYFVELQTENSTFVEKVIVK